jgi:hypothetical protein
VASDVHGQLGKYSDVWPNHANRRSGGARDARRRGGKTLARAQRLMPQRRRSRSSSSEQPPFHVRRTRRGCVDPAGPQPTPAQTAGRAQARPHNVTIGIVEITGYDPGSETETARRFDEEHRKIPARTPAAVQRFRRRLGALVLPALVVDPF